MKPDVKREFARMIDARKRLVDVRGERMEQLLAVRAMLRALLADFFETLDPITNLRLAELTADGSKTNGDLAIALSFFEGTKLRIAVDVHGRFSHAVTSPSAFDDVERLVEIRVSSDLARAQALYEPVGAPGTFRTLDLVDCVMRLLASAVASVEAQLPAVPSRIPEPAAPAVGARIASTATGFVPRPTSAVRPVGARLGSPLRRASAETDVEETTSGSDVLTLRLG